MNTPKQCWENVISRKEFTPLSEPSKLFFKAGFFTGLMVACKEELTENPTEQWAAFMNEVIDELVVIENTLLAMLEKGTLGDFPFTRH